MTSKVHRDNDALVLILKSKCQVLIFNRHPFLEPFIRLRFKKESKSGSSGKRFPCMCFDPLISEIFINYPFSPFLLQQILVILKGDLILLRDLFINLTILVTFHYLFMLVFKENFLKKKIPCSDNYAKAFFLGYSVSS